MFAGYYCGDGSCSHASHVRIAFLVPPDTTQYNILETFTETCYYNDFNDQ